MRTPIPNGVSTFDSTTDGVTLCHPGTADGGAAAPGLGKTLAGAAHEVRRGVSRCVRPWGTCGGTSVLPGRSGDPQQRPHSGGVLLAADPPAVGEGLDHADPP